MAKRKPKDGFNKVADLLYKELREVYCVTCRFSSVTHLPCDDCDNGWGISKKYSKILSSEILGLLEETCTKNNLKS